MSIFADKVYQAIAAVPRGKVTTYAALARSIHAPRAVRAVGNALNKNPRLVTVPCHRVVRSDGTIGGYAGGREKKVRLLMTEGIIIETGKVDLEKYGAWL